MFEVVIAGAGPNGLMLACELALAGVRPVVLEKLVTPSTEQRANGLVGQVIKVLDRRGLLERLTGEPERAALNLTEHATRLADRSDPVPDEVWDDAAKPFDEKQLSAIVLWIATTNFFNRINAATKTPAPQNWG